MDHGKGAGTTEPAPVGPAGDAGPSEAGWYKNPGPTLRRPALYLGKSFLKFDPSKTALIEYVSEPR